MRVGRMEWKADTILAGKPDTEILRRPGCRWEDDVKRSERDVVGTNSFGLE